MNRSSGARSALYWPAHRPAVSDRLSVIDVDVVILDLEDGVPRESLADARAHLIDSHAALRRQGFAVVLRVNGADSDHAADDRRQLSELPQDAAVLVPKPVTAQALAAVSSPGRELWCMAEELRLADDFPTLKAAEPGLTTVVIGIKDLALELGVPLEPDNAVLREAANRLRSAAQAAGLRAIDGIVFGDAEAVARRCARAARDGFDGVSLGRASDGVTVRTAFAGA